MGSDFDSCRRIAASGQSTMNPPASQSFVQRLASVDAYRGFVMFLIIAEVLHLSRVSKALPENPYWKTLSFHQTHVEWVGCSLHDLIQPSFSFLVGVALHSRSPATRGRISAWDDCPRGLACDRLGRSGSLSPLDRPPPDHLHLRGHALPDRAGLSLLVCAGIAPARDRQCARGDPRRVLGGVTYPLPPSDFDYAHVNVPEDWPHRLTGFAATGTRTRTWPGPSTPGFSTASPGSGHLSPMAEVTRP